MESVMAVMIFFWITEGGSVMRIRERGFVADLDIFDVGSWRDMTLLAGAEDD